MNIDESTLRAYVDGELNAQQRDRVESALAHDPALREQAAALRASQLPYRSAYDAVNLPAMPASLEQRVTSLISVASARESRSITRRQWFAGGAAIAASFALGLGVSKWIPSTSAVQVAQATPWVDAIATYQALYVRATVDQAADSSTRAQQVLREFGSGIAGGRGSVSVPDLNDAGLAFKRIQRLGYGDAPLLQMVYMPTEGKPMALCVLPLNKGSAPIRMQHIEGLAVASWQKDGLAYVLTADMPQAKAELLARKIADGKVGALYGASS
jgi:anti-sigma factor RsiW